VDELRDLVVSMAMRGIGTLISDHKVREVLTLVDRA